MFSGLEFPGIDYQGLERNKKRIKLKIVESVIIYGMSEKISSNKNKVMFPGLEYPGMDDQGDERNQS